MAREQTTLTVARREERGQNASRRLRRSGRIPAVVYGGEGESVAISVDEKTVTQVLRSERGVNTLLTLEFDGSGDTCQALLREIQREPVREALLHADFLRVSMTEEIEVDVTLEFSGSPVGVKNQGGVLHVIRHQIPVACLPGNIPDHIVVDVSGLEIGDEIRVEHLQVPETARILEEPHRLVVHVVPPTVEAAPEAEEAAEAPAAEGAPEGAEPEGGEEEGKKED